MKFKEVLEGKIDPSKPLPERSFHARYHQHVDIKSRRDGKGHERAEAIKSGGWKPGSNLNTLPPYRGGEPRTVTDRDYAPRKGDHVYLVPREHVRKVSQHSFAVKDGWKPQPHEHHVVDHDYPDMYGLYRKAFNKE